MQLQQKISEARKKRVASKESAKNLQARALSAARPTQRSAAYTLDLLPCRLELGNKCK